jgi:hypothetical protein
MAPCETGCAMAGRTLKHEDRIKSQQTAMRFPGLKKHRRPDGLVINFKVSAMDMKSIEIRIQVAGFLQIAFAFFSQSGG